MFEFAAPGSKEWLERYLLAARDHHDLEQFVLIEGQAYGFDSEAPAPGRRGSAL